MTGRPAMRLILALALASASGIITMLFTDGLWDAVCLGLALLPLAVGGARRLALRRAAVATRM